MIPKLMKGRSFKGAANYLLHDTHDHGTSERVTWTATRNLITENPHTAWKVMAATAMNADQLKAEAGIKSTGRKVQHSVLHLVLSWHPEESDTLTRDEMRAAAESAIQVLGGAGRQALIIGHNDSPHPHVHVLLNRHCPETGLILASSKEKLKLSQWAQSYEQQRGKIYCEERVLNNDARGRGEYTRAARPLPRQIVEAHKVLREAANDNPDRITQLRETQRGRIRELGVQTRALKERHAQAWDHLQAQDRARRTQIRHETANAIAKMRSHLLDRFRPAWRALRTTEEQHREAFKTREQSRLGRLRNLFHSIDVNRSALDGPKLNIATQLWRGLTSAQERAAMLERIHAQRRQELEAQQRAAIRAALVPVHAQSQLAKTDAGERYHVARVTLIETQKAERTQLRQSWSRLAEAHQAESRAVQASLEGKRSFASRSPDGSIFDRLKSSAGKAPVQSPAREQDNERERS